MSYIEKEKLIKVDANKLLADCEKMSFDIEIFNKPLKVVALDAVKNIAKDLINSENPNKSEIPTGSTTKNDLGVDCISRQAVLDLINADWKYENLEIEINNLPSVTPQERKTGHWVNGEYCSECGCDVPAYIVDWKWQKDMDAKYCPNCGCRMVEPQESENKE